MEIYGIIYLATNRINGKYYIGNRQGRLGKQVSNETRDKISESMKKARAEKPWSTKNLNQ